MTIICDVILMSVITTAYSVTVDIDSQDHPESMDVFKGSFKNGGIYTMFHSRYPYITAVKYAKGVLYKSYINDNHSTDIYVETYRRGRVTMVAIKRLRNVCKQPTRVYHYEIFSDVSIPINRERKDEFVGGPISLELDLRKRPMHPLIIVNSENSAYDGVNYTIAKPYGTYFKNVPNRLRSRFDTIYICPIIPSNDTSPPIIIAHTNKIVFSPDQNILRIWIQTSLNGLDFAIKVPEIKNGTFHTKQILHYADDSKEFQHGHTQLKYHVLQIDIAKYECERPDLVIMKNMRLGDWMYTQYSVAPIRYPIYMTTEVLNSYYNLVIYRAGVSEVVTYVELFDHVIHRWQYIIVHINKIKENPIEGNKFVQSLKRGYKRIDERNGVAYFDLTNLCLGAYMDMLYNIDRSFKSDDEINRRRYCSCPEQSISQSVII